MKPDIELRAGCLEVTISEWLQQNSETIILDRDTMLEIRDVIRELRLNEARY